MVMPDDFSEYYTEFLESTYDSVDRIVLNAYFYMAQSNGGFRTWWRRLMGGEDNLDNTHLMRFAGRFARRIRAYAEKNKIPLIFCQRGERKHDIAKKYIPTNPTFRGVFCILVGRSPALVREVKQCSNGVPHITKKTPLPYVNHYSFHIIDSEWGHLTIKLCPHPPFNAQIILNGHEYMANQAKKEKIQFIKEGNCFTDLSDAAGLARVADTMRAPCSVGRMVQVCERWIYSACLCFALDTEAQKESGFHYGYSVYQVEYSRNYLFTRGRTMDQVFHGIIDRTRAPLDIKVLKTIFGYKYRPFKNSKKAKNLRFEAVVERPVYDLTVFKVHFGKLTVKMYTKGEHVLRIEVIAHNTSDLRCGKKIYKFPIIVESLKSILERFLVVLRFVDVSFIDIGTMDKWPLASKVGATRVGGVDINSLRIRTVMKAVIALSANPQGFTASDLAGKVREIINNPNTHYHSRQAAYDLKKFRGKELVFLINKSRRYEATKDGLRKMAAFLVLRDKVFAPLLASSFKLKAGPKPRNQSEIDMYYHNIQMQMQNIFKIIGIAA